MSKNIEDKEDKGWTVQLGFYPGVVFGFREYRQEENTIYVLYLPFVDIALIVEK